MNGAAFSVLLASLGVYFAAQLARARVRRSERDFAKLKTAREQRRMQPPSLHPVIDPDRCIGSLSCVRACPEGDILGLVDGRVALLEGTACIGHGRCAVECPTSAIHLVLGTPERTLRLPQTNERFESTRPGVFVIGELAGMGLIARALQQGLALAPHLQRSLQDLEKAAAAQPSAPDLDADVIIVGGGPAGIACAVACKNLGLRPLVLEQETLGGAVTHYPRGKVVMSETVAMPFIGSFGRPILSKEELLEDLQDLLDRADLEIQEGQRVTGVQGKAGSFEVQVAERGVVRARLVVLAAGLRGTPRKLGVPGEDNSKVSYRLIEPEQFDGQRVLVVGGGDSAAEAAVQLALESTARVSLSYRGPRLSRCKPIHAERLDSLIAEGRVRSLFETTVIGVEPTRVLLSTSSGRKGRLKNDHVLVFVGGELPTAFLAACGVGLTDHAGLGQLSPEPSSTSERSRRAPRPPKQRLSPGERALAAGLTVLTLGCLYGLWHLGGDYYLAPAADRPDLPGHHDLKPTGLWGHTLGIVATALMMVAFGFVLRKRGTVRGRIGTLMGKGKRSIRGWMLIHIWAGSLGPALVVFHAALLAQNWMAIWSAVGFGLVVGSGLFGLLVYTRLPSDPRLQEAGLSFGPGRVGRRLERLQGDLEQALKGPAPEVTERIRAAAHPGPSFGFFEALFRQSGLKRHLTEELIALRPRFLAAADARIADAAAHRVLSMRLSAAVVDELKRAMQPWLILHIVAAVLTSLVVCGHIGLAVYLGFQAGFGGSG